MATRDNMFISSIPESGLTPVQFSTKSSNYGGLAQNVIHMLEQRKYKAAEASSAVDAAFSAIGSNLHQDPKTATWFNNLKAEYTGRLEDMMNQEAYEDTIFEATKMAREVMSRPDVISRIKTNAQYEQAKKDVDELFSKGDISQDNRDRWYEENAYEFKPILDKQTGTVIGGEDYKADWMPVSNVDMIKVYQDLKRTIGEEYGYSENVVFLGPNGYTKDPTEGTYGMAYKTTTEIQEIPAEKLKRFFEKTLDDNPEVKEYFKQQWDTKRWKYNKLTDAEKQQYDASDIIDSDGEPISLQSYIRNKVYPALDDVAERKVKQHTDYGDAFKTRAQSQQDSSLAMLLEEARVQSVPIEIPMTDATGVHYGNLNNALSNIRTAFSRVKIGGVNPLDNPYVKKQLNDGNYQEAYRFLNARINAIPNKEQQVLAMSAIRSMLDEGRAFNQIVTGLSNEDANTVRAYSAIMSGASLESVTSVPEVKRYNKLKSDIFSYKDKNKTIPIDNIELQFEDYNVYNQLLSKLRLNESELKQAGITLGILGTTRTITVDRKSNKFTELSTALNDINLDKVWLAKYDDNNIQRSKYKLGQTTKFENPDYRGNLSPWTNSPYIESSVYPQYINPFRNLSLSENSILSRLKDKTNNILTTNGKVMRTSLTTEGYDDPTTAVIGRNVGNGIKLSEFLSVQKDLEAKHIDAAAVAINHLEDYEAYMYDPNTNTAGTLIGNTDIQTIKENLLAAIQEKRLSLHYSSSPTTHGYVSILEIKPKINEKGETVKNKESTFIYVDGMLQSQAAETFARNPDNLRINDFRRSRALGTPVRDIQGSFIDYESPVALDRYKLKDAVEDVINSTIYTYAAENENMPSDAEIEQLVLKTVQASNSKAVTNADLIRIKTIFKQELEALLNNK